MNASYLGSQFLSLLPLVVACGAGFVLAVVNWNRSRKAATLSIVAAGLILASRVGYALVYAALIAGSQNGNLGAAEMSRVSMVLVLGSSFVSAAGVAILFYAVFVDRTDRSMWIDE